MGNYKYLVLHCTATPAGRQVTGEEIRLWHLSPVSQGGRGWSQVGYTDLFHLSGLRERLVKNNEDDTVDPWEVTNGVKGMNGICRHIVYVGGCAPDGKTPADTRTQAQRIALEAYIKDHLRAHPQILIAGHNQFAAKACPSFDVPAWLRSVGVAEANIYKQPKK